MGTLWRIILLFVQIGQMYTYFNRFIIQIDKFQFHISFFALWDFSLEFKNTSSSVKLYLETRSFAAFNRWKEGARKIIKIKSLLLLNRCSKTIGCQSVCSQLLRKDCPYWAEILRVDSPWGAYSYRLKNIWIRRTVS